MKKAVLTLIVGCALMAQAAAQSGAPKVKVLVTPEDATKTTVLVGRVQSVSGNLANQRGEWALERHDHATRVTYRANITPGFALPPLIGPAIVGRDVRIMVESVAREMLRRAQATER